MMTRQKRMVVVDAWLTSGQTLLDYADNVGLDVDTLLGWIVDYGHPAALSTWIPVRILDGWLDRFPLDEAIPSGGLKPGICPSQEYRHVWIPVVIRERA
jgi:hypothetical protein